METLIVNSDTMGAGNDDLGRLLMEKFFMTLAESESLPKTIHFYNTGVKLCLPGSPIEPYIKALKARGVTIKACGTCTDYFNVERMLEADPGTMRSLVETLCREEGTVTI